MFSDDDGVENPGSWEHERQQPVKPTVRRQVHEWSEAPGLVEQAPDGGGRWLQANVGKFRPLAMRWFSSAAPPPTGWLLAAPVAARRSELTGGRPSTLLLALEVPYKPCCTKGLH
jgi:hypothetical protein